MSEDFYGAFMLRGNIGTTTDVKAVAGVGCYSVATGNSTAPGSAAGVLLVLPPASKPKRKFIKENEWNVFTLVNGAWQGMGTAAIHDVTTSHTDGTAEHVLRVADFGVGGYGTDTMLTADTVRKPLRNGFYGVSADPTYGNASLISFGYDSGSQVQIISKQGGQAPRLAISGSNPQGVFGNWGKIFTEFEPPTAADTKALPLAGGEMSGPITLSNTGRGSWASQRDGKAPLYQVIDSGSASEYWPIIKQKYKATGSAWSAGVLVNADRFVIYYSAADGTDDKTSYFSPDGTFNPGSFANFDARYISNLQLGAQVSVARDSSGYNKAAAGYVMMGTYSTYQDSNWEMDNILCKPIQKYINGAWVTISG
ncbi:hypothetical protein D3C81_31720 [compost metagenome]